RPVCVLLLFFFFFQAEDGIRYWSVTGVQTCALPISQDEHAAAAPRTAAACSSCGNVSANLSELATVSRLTASSRFLSATFSCSRSEERRVGKEWRSGGEPDDLRKERVENVGERAEEM